MFKGREGVRTREGNEIICVLMAKGLLGGKEEDQQGGAGGENEEQMRPSLKTLQGNR